jgi:hypothetical protein
MTRAVECDHGWQITDAQWQEIAPLLPPVPSHAKGGRPRMPARHAMEAICYVLLTGCSWKRLPGRFGPPSTVYGHFQAWRRDGVIRSMVVRGLIPSPESIDPDLGGAPSTGRPGEASRATWAPEVHIGSALRIDEGDEHAAG